MVARIYKPSRTAMQAGMAATKRWVLEFAPEEKREVEPLMGWTSSRDMKQQVKLYFPTKEKAISYARRNGIPFRVYEPHTRKRRPKSYSDNFKYGRVGPWTH